VFECDFYVFSGWKIMLFVVCAILSYLVIAGFGFFVNFGLLNCVLQALFIGSGFELGSRRVEKSVAW